MLKRCDVAACFRLSDGLGCPSIQLSATPELARAASCRPSTRINIIYIICFVEYICDANTALLPTSRIQTLIGQQLGLSMVTRQHACETLGRGSAWLSTSFPTFQALLDHGSRMEVCTARCGTSVISRGTSSPCGAYATSRHAARGIADGGT